MIKNKKQLLLKYYDGLRELNNELYNSIPEDFKKVDDEKLALFLKSINRNESHIHKFIYEDEPIILTPEYIKERLQSLSLKGISQTLNKEKNNYK